MTRHTMGQEWGGRRKTNPENAPKVTRNMVINYAKNHSIYVFRGDFLWVDDVRSKTHSKWGQWWYLDEKDIWRTLGYTNYLALRNLQYMMGEW